MVLKILGALLAFLGLGLIIGAPGDRGQSLTYGPLGIKIGAILLLLGVFLWMI
jgi:hypothetical protein